MFQKRGMSMQEPEGSVPSILGNTKEVPGPGALIATASVSEVRWKRLESGVLVLWLLLWSKMM